MGQSTGHTLMGQSTKHTLMGESTRHTLMGQSIRHTLMVNIIGVHLNREEQERVQLHFSLGTHI